MKKLFVNPLFRAVLKEALLSIVNSIAIDPQERAKVQGLLANLDDHAEIIDADGDGIPDHLETPPPATVRNAGEPSYEELLAAWRAAQNPEGAQ